MCEWMMSFAINSTWMHNTTSSKNSHCVLHERWKKGKKKNRGKSSWVRGKDNFRWLFVVVVEERSEGEENNSRRLVGCWWEKLFLYNLCSFFHSRSLQELKINTSCVCRQRRWVFEGNLLLKFSHLISGSVAIGKT